MAKSSFFEIIEGTDGRFRIALAEKFARRFATAIGGLFVSPALTSREDAERIGWAFVRDATSGQNTKELRRSHAEVAAEKQMAAAVQTSLF